MLMAVLIAVCISSGISALDHWHGPAYTLTNDLLVPSLMMASGRGFVNVKPETVPGLREFLNFGTPAFSPGQIPEQIPVSDLDAFQRYHRYLLYAVGGTWWLFGVTWETMKILIVAFFCVTALVTYGLFRLGMNPILSAVGTLLFIGSTPCLGALANIRDFGKIPFVLGTMLILGFLVSKPVSRKTFLGMALLLGLVTGIGLGFRRDLMMCVPPCVVTLALCQRDPLRKVFVERIVAIGIFLVSFVVTSWPILVAFHEAGSLGYHDTLMGMAVQRDDEVGVSRSSYERMYAGNDMLVVASAVSGCYRSASLDPTSYTQDNDIRERRLIIDMGKTFPADMITRCYAAVLAAINADILWRSYPVDDNFVPPDSPLTRHLGTFGPGYAALVFLILACRNMRTAWVLLGLLMYFCGYLTLQFNLRHYFHVGFLALWFPGFLLDHAGRVVVQRVRARTQTAANDGALRVPWFVYARRVALFSAVTGLALLGPLWTARAWQHRSVDKLVEACASADLQPLETESQPWDNGVMFRVKDWPRFLPSGGAALAPDLQTSYLVAVFAQPGEPSCIEVRYESCSGGNDNTYPLNTEPTGLIRGGSLQYFFPVYEWSIPGNWSRFAGVVAPFERAGDFRGLYRVNDLEHFTLLPNVSLPEERDAFRWCECLQWRPNRLAPRCRQASMESDVRTQARLARQRMAGGDLDGAMGIYQTTLARDPRNLELLMGLADTLDAKNEFDAALKTYRDVLAANPLDTIPYNSLDAFLRKRSSLDARVQEWSALSTRGDRACPSYACYYLGRALEDKGDFDASVAAYQGALEAGLQRPEVYKSLSRVLLHKGDYPNAIPPIRAALALTPADASLWADLVRALCEIGNLAEARTAADQCRENGMALAPDLRARLSDTL